MSTARRIDDFVFFINKADDLPEGDRLRDIIPNLRYNADTINLLVNDAEHNAYTPQRAISISEIPDVCSKLGAREAMHEAVGIARKPLGLKGRQSMYSFFDAVALNTTLIEQKTDNPAGDDIIAGIITALRGFKDLNHLRGSLVFILRSKEGDTSVTIVTKNAYSEIVPVPVEPSFGHDSTKHPVSVVKLDTVAGRPVLHPTWFDDFLYTAPPMQIDPESIEVIACMDPENCVTQYYTHAVPFFSRDRIPPEEALEYIRQQIDNANLSIEGALRFCTQELIYRAPNVLSHDEAAALVVCLLGNFIEDPMLGGKIILNGLDPDNFRIALVPGQLVEEAIAIQGHDRNKSAAAAVSDACGPVNQAEPVVDKEDSSWRAGRVLDLPHKLPDGVKNREDNAKKQWAATESSAKATLHTWFGRHVNIDEIILDLATVIGRDNTVAEYLREKLGL